MQLEYRKLSDTEIHQGLAELKGWALQGGKLVRNFEFGTYLAGVEFASSVGHMAEKLDHHPDMEIGWKIVRISMNTHSVGGISPYDFELARKIDAME